MTKQTDIARIRAELKRTQALMKQTKECDKPQLRELSKALNLKLAELARRQSNGV